MVAASISTYGPLWTKDTKITPEIRKAARKAAAYAEFRVKARTPVRTGVLRANNSVTLEGYGLRFTNPTYYSAYVELGSKYMAARPYIRPAIPEAQAVFRTELAKGIGRKLSGQVIGELGTGIPSSSSPLDSAVYGALTRAVNPVKDGRKGFKSKDNNFKFSYKGLKKYEKRFGKARPKTPGKLRSKKAQAVGAI